LLIAKGRERLAVNKRAAQKVDTARFKVKKLKEVEVKNSIGLQLEIRSQLWKT
jgi:hypothetical protein